jgi:hypothetical protein
MVTSTAFAPAMPTWSLSRATPQALARARSAEWQPLDPPWLRLHARTADDDPAEGNLAGLGVTFPHNVQTADKPAQAFRASPWADDVLLSLGLAALDGGRAREHPTLLALSLSANDYVGHVFGPDSWEAWDELLRLDRALAGFFAALDQRYGERGWSVVLSADHGSVSMPELPRSARPWCPPSDAAAALLPADPWQRPCEGGVRVDPDALAAELARAARAVLGDGAWVAGVADPYVHLTRRALELPADQRSLLLAALATAIRARPGVDRVLFTSAFAGACPPLADEGTDALLCRAMRPDAREAPLYVLLQRGSFFDPMYTPGKGSGHGSPYLYDRAVPLLVRAPGRVAAGATIGEPRPFSTFVQTASSLLGIPPPTAAEPGADLAAARRP